MMLIPLLMRSALRYQFVDIPNERKIHDVGMLRVGGIAMALGALTPIIMWVDITREVRGLLLGALVIVFFGVWDDRRDLGYRVKFFGQLMATILVVLYGGISIRFLPWTGAAGLPTALSISLTVVVLLGITNAINLSDGLDGLAGGTTMLSIGMIALLANISGNTEVTLMAIALIGSILGFLRFNTYPARVFMGDGGSQFLGFMSGVLVILVTQGVMPAFSTTLPILIMGLPVLDTLYVMGLRIHKGHSPFTADRNHIHHKLLTMGFDHFQAVSIIYLVQSVLVVTAYLLRYQSDVLIVGLYVAFCALAIFILGHTSRNNWRIPSYIWVNYPIDLMKKMKLLRENGSIHEWSIKFFLVSISTLFLVGAISAITVSHDIGVLAAGLFLVMLLLFPRQKNKPFSWIERACIYTIGTLIVYLLQHEGHNLEIYRLVARFIFVLLGLVVITALIFSANKRFHITPLDFLVIFIAFVAPSLPDSIFSEWRVGEVVAGSIIIFYSLEILLTEMSARWDKIRYVALSTTLILCLHSIV